MGHATEIHAQKICNYILSKTLSRKQWVGRWEDACGACLCVWFVSVSVGGD